MTFSNEPVPVLRVVVKTPYSVEQMTPLIRAEVAAIDPGLPIGDVERVADITARSVATWRFAASLMATFAVVAVSLAAVGLFAVVGCWVSERTAEIGVRVRSAPAAARCCGCSSRVAPCSVHSASRAAWRSPRSPRVFSAAGSWMPARWIGRRLPAPRR